MTVDIESEAILMRKMASYNLKYLSITSEILTKT